MGRVKVVLVGSGGHSLLQDLYVRGHSSLASPKPQSLAWRTEAIIPLRHVQSIGPTPSVTRIPSLSTQEARTGDTVEIFVGAGVSLGVGGDEGLQEEDSPLHAVVRETDSLCTKVANSKTMYRITFRTITGVAV